MQTQTVRVLIAEDDYLVSMMVRGLLESLGHVIAGEASDGHEAVELTASLRPDVVLMDLSMPHLDGIEATRLIHQVCPTPIVMLTAYDARELVARAGDVGVGAYLVKPPSRPDLERAIIIARARFDDMMALRRLNADLQARNEELDAFSQIVAHDLQNPLNLLLGYSEGLRMYGVDMTQAELEDSLKSMTRTVYKMRNIVDELLVLAQVRKKDVRLQLLELASIVHEAKERLRDLIAESGAEVSLPANWPEALGYAPWVEEIWVNYLSNALKYGGKPPKITIWWHLEGKFARFFVCDNGPGLTQEEQAQLFKPFERLNTVRARGHGLGLSIVRLIAEKLGGSVAVESTPGHGSEFSFTLPRPTS
ncbi:MAG: response regulator [Anaerolineae bacterium]|nr:response regulator [Anaerolineae bacterium]